MRTRRIKNAENGNVIPENVTDEGLNEAYTEADRQNWTKLELENYLRAAIKEQDEIGRIEFAEKKRSYLIAKNLKNRGLDTDLIADATGLTKAEIEAI